GPGMMWERTAELVEERGGEVHLRSEVIRVNRKGNRVISVDVKHWHEDGRAPVTERVEGEHFVNTMALRDLIHAFDPPPPPEVVEAADKLKYRDFLIVTLVLDHADRSEERRVGKECRSRGAPQHETKTGRRATTVCRTQREPHAAARTGSIK